MNESYHSAVDSIAIYTGAELTGKLANDCSRAALIDANCCCAFFAECSHRNITAFVVDPSFGDKRVVKSLFEMARANRIPIVLYSYLTLGSVHKFVEILADHPDLSILGTAERPYSLIERHILARKPSATTHLLCRLAERIRIAPPLMALSLAGLFYNDRINSVTQVANESAVSRRGLYRWHDKLGLCPPHELLAVATLSRAYSAVRYTSAPTWLAGQASGYRSKKTFARQCESLTGLMPCRLKGLEESTLAACLANMLTKRDAQRHDALLAADDEC